MFDITSIRIKNKVNIIITSNFETLTRFFIIVGTCNKSFSFIVILLLGTTESVEPILLMGMHEALPILTISGP